jgi:hypothetical protein
MFPEQDGWVELPPPPDNRNAGFWSFGLLQLCLVLALAGYIFVARSAEPEAALETMILSATEPAASDAVAPVAEVPIPRMREPDGAPAPGWVVADVDHSEGGNAPRDFVTHANRDMLGGDYDSFRNVSQEECALRCRSDKRCRAYTYNTWENACFVKSSLSALRIEPRGVTGVVASAKVGEEKRPASIQRGRSRLFPGVPYRQVLAPAYEGCAKACLDDSACLGFNYSKTNRSCALMASLDKPVSAKATDFGMKLQRTANSRRGPRYAPPSGYADLPPEIAPVFDAVMHEFMRY